MTWFVFGLLPLMAAAVFAIWRGFSIDPEWDEEAKTSMRRGVIKTLMYVGCALVLWVILFIWGPPLRGWVALPVVLIALVLALLSVLTLVDLPDRFDTWLWKEKDGRPRVRRLRRTSFYMLLLFMVGFWVVVGLVNAFSGPSQPEALSPPPPAEAPSAPSADRPVESPSPSPSPSAEPPEVPSQTSGCEGVPELYTYPEDQRESVDFFPGSVERCLNGEWEEWGNDPAPTTIEVIQAAQNSEYFYFGFKLDGQQVLARYKLS